MCYVFSKFLRYFQRPTLDINEMSLEHQRNAISIFVPYLKEGSTHVYKSVLLCGIPMKWKTKGTSVKSVTKKGKKRHQGVPNILSMAAINLAPDSQKKCFTEMSSKAVKKRSPTVKQLNSDKK